MPYTTDLTTEQFNILDVLLPKSKTRTCVVSRHAIVNGIMYQLKNGSQWRDLPKDLPKWQTIYSQFRRWKINRAWEDALVELEKQERKIREKK
jgi:transposase